MAEPCLDPPADPLESLREEAEFFAEAEMERLFAGDNMDTVCDLLDAEIPGWYARCQERIADVKFGALQDELREARMEAMEP